MSKDKALERIAHARAMCSAMLGQGILDCEVSTAITILDAIREDVIASWPLSKQSAARVIIGRYAARNLDEPAYGALSAALSDLDWDLKK